MYSSRSDLSPSFRPCFFHFGLLSPTWMCSLYLKVNRTKLSPSSFSQPPLVLCALLCPWRSLADPTQMQHHRLLCMPHAPVLQPLTAALGPAFLTSPLSCCPTASKRISQPQPLLLSPFLSISPSFIAQRTF